MNESDLKNGIPFALRLRFNINWFLEFAIGWAFPKDFFKKRCIKANQRIHDYLMALPQKGQKLTPEIYENITPDYFVKHVMSKGKPAILRGLAEGWPCCEKWSPDYFAEKFKGYPLIVTNMHSDRGGDNEEILMEDYVRDIKEGQRKYARFSKIMHDYPSLKDDFNMEVLMSHKRKTDFWVATQFFMGPPTTFTYLHCAFINNLFVQAHGLKKWLIYPPKYNSLFMPPVDRAPTFRTSKEYELVPEGHSVFDQLDHYDFLVEKGDVLYNPPFHWHFVSNKTMSISLSFRILSIFSALRASPMLSFMTAFATNPPALQGLYGTWKGTNFLNFYAKKV
jgi:hypothetical protein